MKPINFIQAGISSPRTRTWALVTLSAVSVVCMGALWALVPQTLTLYTLHQEKKQNVSIQMQLQQAATENAHKKTALAELKRRFSRIERLTKNPRFPLENLADMAKILHQEIGIQSLNWQGKTVTATLACKNSEGAMHALQALKKSGHFSNLKLVSLSKSSGLLHATIQGSTRVT